MRKGTDRVGQGESVGEVNRLGVDRGRGGAGRLTGLILVVLTEGQREERGRDVRVGLLKPTGGVGRTRRRVEGLEVLSGW